MTPLSFQDIATRLARWQFPERLDGVVGIASGGVVPAALVAQQLGLEMTVMALNYRDEANEIARRALNAAKRQPPGSEYRLRDLFQQQRWERFSKGARLRAGRMFLEEVGSAVHGVRATRKSSTNHQYYQTA